MPRPTWKSEYARKQAVGPAGRLGTLSPARQGTMGIQRADRSLRPAGIPHGALPELRISSIGPLPSRNDLSNPFRPLRRVHHPDQNLSNALGDRVRSPYRPVVLFRISICGKSSGKIATPEKALLDFLYLTPGKDASFPGPSGTRASPRLQRQRSPKDHPADSIAPPEKLREPAFRGNPESPSKRLSWMVLRLRI